MLPSSDPVTTRRATSDSALPFLFNSLLSFSSAYAFTRNAKAVVLNI